MKPRKPDSDSVSVSVSDIPKLDEFMAYGLAKMPDVNKESLSLKYESWKENGWSVNRQGKKQPIKNWKSRPYLIPYHTYLNNLKKQET